MARNLYKSIAIAIVSICILTVSYPQAMVRNVDINVDIPENIVDKFIKENSKYLEINIRYPQVVNIPNVDKVNKEIEEKINSTVKEVKEVVNEYYGHGEPAPIGPYVISSDYNVTNTKDILSFYIDLYQFTGGAHGITVRYVYNINMNTGEKVSLDNLFQNKDYKNIIDKEILKQIDKNKNEYFVGKEGFNGINENTNFYLIDDSIVIFFQIYEIAPYVKGFPEFRIPLKVIK